MASKEFHRYFFFLFSFLRRGISPILLNGSIEKEWPSSLPRIRAKEEREKAAERIERTYNCWEIENSAPINPATPCENDLLGSFDFCADPPDTHFRPVGTNEANFTSRISSGDRSSKFSASVLEKLSRRITFLGQNFPFLFEGSI